MQGDMGIMSFLEPACCCGRMFGVDHIKYRKRLDSTPSSLEPLHICNMGVARNRGLSRSPPFVTNLCRRPSVANPCRGPLCTVLQSSFCRKIP